MHYLTTIRMSIQQWKLVDTEACLFVVILVICLCQSMMQRPCWQGVDTKQFLDPGLEKNFEIYHRRYSWCLALAEKNFTHLRLKFCLQDLSIANYTAKEIADLLHSRGLWPAPLSIIGEDFEVEVIKYDKVDHCWEVAVPQVQSQCYIFVKGNKNLFTSGSFIGEPLLPNVVTLQTTEAFIHFKPSSTLKYKMFPSACFSYQKILATDTSLLFTNDGFGSFTSLGTRVKNSTVEFSLATSIVLTQTHIFILLKGDLYVSGVKTFNFTKIELKEGRIEQDIVGISTSPLCYGFMPPENSLLYAWSHQKLYKIMQKGPELTATLINTENASIEIALSSLLMIRPTANPDFSYLQVKKSSQVTIFKCLITKNMVTDCKEIPTPASIAATNASIEALSSAKTALLLWNDVEVVEMVDNQTHSQRFSSPVKAVYLNQEKNGWIIQTQENLLHFGCLYCRNYFVLDVETTPNSTLMFLPNDVVRIIEWSGDNVSQIRDFQVMEKLKDVTTSQLFLHFSHSETNVMRLDGSQDNFTAELTVSSSWRDGYEIKFYRDFQNLSVQYTTADSMSTRYFTASIIVRSKTRTVTVMADCDDSPRSCRTGYGLVELAYAPVEQSAITSAPIAKSRLFLINMTCPAGLTLRIVIDGQKNCTEQSEECYLILAENEKLHLKFEIYRYQEYLSHMADDILLTELGNRTGFTLDNINLIKKTCHHCSKFQQLKSNSQIMLQSVRSACPCRLNDENANEWVANISFQNAYVSSGKNKFHFSAQSLGSSFCDLRTEFFVEVIPDAALTFSLWEYILMLAFALITIFSLCISYRNYVKHMELHREKQRKARERSIYAPS